VAESEIHRGQGAAFGFADGHVEWIVEPRAGELLAELRTAAR
jgi:prepilin-type processing-associated H-X9-DG protein